MGSLPLNWSQWSSDANTSFSVTNNTTNPPLSGNQDFSVVSGSGASSQAVTRAWLDETMPADVQVSAAVYVGTLIPAQVIARGSNLDTPDGPNGPSFYALQLSRGSPGPKLELIKDVNGTQTSLGSITASTYMQNVYLRETLDVEGATERAQLFDPATNQYLNSSGQWQSGPTWALTVLDTTISGSGFVGVGRPASYVGTATFDDFSVLTPAADQTFDSTPVGSLPDNWSQWSSTGSNNFFAVSSPTNPKPISGPNVMTVTPLQSAQTARAWLNTSLPADLTASAEVYLNALTPAQVFARGSDLNSATPTYYAVEVYRGMTVKLVKVVNGVETDLGSTTSSGYLDNTWVQETLVLSGSTLQAQVYSPELNEYLNSSGNWQSAQVWAVSASDTSISGGGQAGLARPVVQEYVETNYFDDFTTAVGVDAQDFESTPTGSLPTGWAQWSSDGSNNSFAVANDSNGPFLSAYNVLASNEAGSGTSARAWDETQQLTNAQVSAGFVLPSNSSVQLLARGTDLGTANPSYYELSITPGENGPTVQLVRVNAGVAAPPLATLAPSLYSSYVDGQWLQATLYVNGASVRAQVYRADTGQYLNSLDLWQATPTYALNVTDTSSQALTGAGYAGVERPSGYAGTLDFDNVAVVPVYAENTPPTATVTAPSGTLTGVVSVSATATDDVGVSKVEFYVDNVLRWVDTAAPYTWAFDTSFVPNGTHTLLVMAYADADNVGEASTTITTSNNTTLTLPSFPRHQSNIGIAELAYRGKDSPYPYDPNLLKNNVDVVVPDPSYLSGIESVAPNTPQLIYTNVSNIYGSELTSWLNYAEQNSIDPEQAFYHVSIATPWSGSLGSTQPVDWFWSVYAYQNGSWQPDLTSAAHSGSNNAVPFGNLSTGSVVGDTLNVGYTDKFREIDINLSQARSGGSYVLEYPSAVDSNGNPTTWSTLTTLSDTTNGLTTSGTITFDPPANWQPAVVDGSGNNSPQYYYVRFRTTAAFSTSPAATTILGANYTGAVSDNQGNVTGTYTIPAFDAAADTDHDGYLNDAEYAKRAPGMDARFEYQSRLFTGYGEMRFVTNPSSPAFKDWAVNYEVQNLNSVQNQYADGLFVDNSPDNPPTQDTNFQINGSNFDLLEPVASYSEDYASVLNAIGQAIAPKWIMANTGGANNVLGGQPGQTFADPVIQKVQANYEEFGIQALAQNYQQFLTLSNLVNYRATNDSPGYAVLDSKSTGGLETDGRTQLATLAAYYLLAPSNPSQGALDFFGGEAPSTYWTVPNSNPTQYQHWSPAAAYNIGTPTNTWSQFDTGNDPENKALTYYVYQRSFTGQNGQSVLVLYKPLSTNGSVSGTTDDATATQKTLPGSYYLLQANGTLSSTPQTTVTLRNGEGAILVQTGGMMTPMLAGATPAAVSTPTAAVAGTSSTAPTSRPSSVNQASPEPTIGELLNAEFFEKMLPGLFIPNASGESQAPMGQPADQRTLLADLDHFLSLWAVAKIARSNGSATIWPGESSQTQIVTPVPLAGIPPWLGSSNLPRARGNSSPFGEALWPVDDVVAESVVRLSR